MTIRSGKLTGSYYTPPEDRYRHGAAGRRGACDERRFGRCRGLGLACRYTWPTRPRAPAPSCWACCRESPKPNRGRRRQRRRAGGDRAPLAKRLIASNAVGAVRGGATTVRPADARLAERKHHEPEISTRALFVTNTLGNPQEDDEVHSRHSRADRPQSRKVANKIKRGEPITVVIGNPPYKEKSQRPGRLGRRENARRRNSAPLADWMPPREWGVGAHSKHLRNLYIYFWRWATWKVFGGISLPDHPAGDPASRHRVLYHRGGFPGRPRLQKMRDYLRRDTATTYGSSTAPPKATNRKSTRASSRACNSPCASCLPPVRQEQSRNPGRVRFQALPAGSSNEKFAALSASSPSTAKPGWIAQRIGALLFCRLRPARGQPTRRWKTSLSTTAPVSCRAGPGSSRRTRTHCSGAGRS